MDVPNMLSEVVEAIHLQYEDEPDLELDCMLYLNSIATDTGTISNWFYDHWRCRNCGSKLSTYHYKEPHTECGVGVYEDMCEVVCPHCDMGGEVEY